MSVCAAGAMPSGCVRGETEEEAVSRQHPHPGQHDQGGVFSTPALPKLSYTARARLLPQRHSVTHTFSSAFPWLRGLAGLHSESSQAEPHPDDVCVGAPLH